MAVLMAECLVDHAALDTALCAALADAETGVDVRDDPPRNWEHDPAGWSVLPKHDYHILTCRGPRCTALGAGECWARLAQSLNDHGLRGNDERVLVTQTGCLYPCNHGPVMVVYPAGVWYGGLTSTRIEHIVSEHLMAKRVVQDLRIVPSAPPTKDEDGTI
jgi:(2Fe-2S) ferredoxin